MDAHRRCSVTAEVPACPSKASQRDRDVNVVRTDSDLTLTSAMHTLTSSSKRTALQKNSGQAHETPVPSLYLGYASMRGIIRDEEGGRRGGGGKDSSDNFLSISTKAGLYNFIMSFILKIFKWDDDKEVSLSHKSCLKMNIFCIESVRLSGFKWLGGLQAERTCYWLIF